MLGVIVSHKSRLSANIQGELAQVDYNKIKHAFDDKQTLILKFSTESLSKMISYTQQLKY